MVLANKKILLLSTGDSIGGAYELMYRMASALNSHCEQVCLAVKNKRYTDTFVKSVSVVVPKSSFFKRCIHSVQSRLHLLPPELAAVAKSNYVFYYQEEEQQHFVRAEYLLQQIGFVPDIIFVGLTTGFINTNEIARLHQLTNAVIAYVMLDVYPITGGCHVLCNCKEYQRGCVQCPAVKNTSLANLPLKQFANKWRLYSQMSPLFVGASCFVRRILRESPLTTNDRVVPMYSCIPTDIFNMNNREYAKHIWRIPKGKKVILAGADNVRDPRKGRHYFVESIKQLVAQYPNIFSNVMVVLVGNHNTADEETKQIPLETKYVDYIRDMRLLSLLYQASDIYVMSSLEEGGPMMVPEAMLCGALVVGFQTGFLENEDIIQSRVNGYRVPLADVGALEKALYEALSLTDAETIAMRQCAQQTAINKMSDKAFISIMKQIEL